MMPLFAEGEVLELVAIEIDGLPVDGTEHSFEVAPLDEPDCED